MSDGVKARRRYDSRRRQEQARENRRGVLEAARRMFLERGYAATTVSAIAPKRESRWRPSTRRSGTRRGW